MQHSSHLLMIQPIQFNFNAETAVNNSFQINSNDDLVSEKARNEFEDFMGVLTAHGIDITVVADTPYPYTPDSIFPNNWISFHSDGTVCLYPMFAVNRRMERKQSVLHAIEEKFSILQKIDFTHFEAENIFLEGTGSMVLDRDHKIAYACLSPRTDLIVLNEFCKKMDYQPIAFHAVDSSNKAIYHTNVMLCVADEYMVICLDAISNLAEQKMVIESIEQTGKKIIAISLAQMNCFAGNMLQVHNNKGNKFLVMSSQAFHSLDKKQVAEIEAFNPIIHSDLTTIETNGGGSARCMMAEIFLPLK
jgi:hypothetical protein